MDNIEGELKHLRSVLKMNDYPKKFIDNAMKTRQHDNTYRKRPNTSFVSVYRIIGSASHKIERILKKAGISIEIEKHSMIDQEGKSINSTRRALFTSRNEISLLVWDLSRSLYVFHLPQVISTVLRQVNHDEQDRIFAQT